MKNESIRIRLPYRYPNNGMLNTTTMIMFFFLNNYRYHMKIIILFVVIILVILIYYISKSTTPVDVQLRVPTKTPPSLTEVQVFLGDTPKKVIMRTKKDLEDEIEKAVDRILPVNSVRDEINDVEARLMDRQKQNLEEIRSKAEQEARAKEAELVARKKRFNDMLKQKKEEIARKKSKIQEERAAKLLIEREQERLNKEKRLAELKLKRQTALDRMQTIQKKQSEKEKKTKEEELRLLELARQKVEEDKIVADREAKERQKKIEMDQLKMEADEVKFQQERTNLIEQQKLLEKEYEAFQEEQTLKVQKANIELEELLVVETERQRQMEEEGEKRRDVERQKLLRANEQALKELEEAEAEQVRMDAEDVEMRRQFESESAIAENAQRASTSQSQAEYDAKIASDQALFDTQVSESERTGDAEQRAERQAATDLESQSLEDFNKLTEEEKERERVAATKLAEDSKAGGTTVPEGDNSSLNFDYDAYMRGEAIPCAVEPWGEWKKVGSLIEETETIVSGRMNQKREIQTGRWSQRWKRERKEIRPALNGGRCILEELKFTSQASKGCSESDWNPWKNVGDPYKQKRGNQWKWYVNQERDRATAVVADGCNLRTDAKRTELPAQSCRYSGWSAYRNITGAYEQTKSVRVGRGSVNKKTGKWVVKQQATRSILEQAKYDGTPCSNSGLATTREVVLDPVNCTMKRWGPWYSISDRIDRVCRNLGLRRGRSCTDTHYARQKRTRGVHRPAAYGGAGCGTSEQDSETKRDPITCIRSWGAWYNYGSRRCIPGSGRGRNRKPRKCFTPQRRDATISRHPQYGAPACGPLTEIKE